MLKLDSAVSNTYLVIGGKVIELDTTTIAFVLAGIGLGFTALVSVVGGVAFIHIAIKAVQTSDEFTRKADTAVVKDLVDGVSEEIEDNMDVILPRIRRIEAQLKQFKKP